MIQPQLVHPIIIHFPIVFVITLVIFDWIATLRGVAVTGRSAASNASTGLAILAGASALIAFYFGGVALDIAEAGGFHSDVAEIHEHLGEMTAIILAGWALVRGLLWYRDTKLSTPITFAIPTLQLVGFGLVLATAYYGGQLVYDLGVNVVKVAA